MEVITTANKQQIQHYKQHNDFLINFAKDVGYMKNLTKAEIFVLFGFLKIVNRQNEVIINPTIQERICDEFSITKKSIRVLISNLVKKAVIQRTGRGIYTLNDDIFGRGNWSDLKKLKINIEWNFKDLTKKLDLEADYSQDLIEKV